MICSWLKKWQQLPQLPLTKTTTFVSLKHKNIDNPISWSLCPWSSSLRSSLWMKLWILLTSAWISLQLKSKSKNSELWEKETSAKAKLRTEKRKWWTWTITLTKRKPNSTDTISNSKVFRKSKPNKRPLSISFPATRNDKNF